MSDMNVGGQAVIEGVMMRTPHAFTVAVRAPDGTIVLKEDNWRSLWDKLTFLRWPFLRGTVVMVEALVNGLQALTFAANVATPEESAAPSTAKSEAKASTGASAVTTTPAPSALSNAQLTLTIASSLGMGLVMFVALPHLLTAGLGWLLGSDALNPDGILFHVVDGIFKLGIFIGYIALISLMEDIRRVFQYHGAEHKSVYAYEAGVPLTVENVRKYSTLHPRCGTSFLMFVMLVSIFLFSAFFPLFMPAFEGLPAIARNLLMVAIKVPLMLPVAGISYEAIRFSGKFPNNPVLGLLSRPGLWMQHLTTQEPTDDQLEVAIAALSKALEREAAWQNQAGNASSDAALLSAAAS